MHHVLGIIFYTSNLFSILFRSILSSFSVPKRKTLWNVGCNLLECSIYAKRCELLKNTKSLPHKIHVRPYKIPKAHSNRYLKKEKKFCIDGQETDSIRGSWALDRTGPMGHDHC